MPKEKINHTTEAQPIHWDPDTDGGDQPHHWSEPDVQRDAELAVGWRRNSWVQISIEADPRYFELAAAHPDAQNGVRTSVYTPPLSRDELNHLIRTLRRARDAAYGSDA